MADKKFYWLKLKKDFFKRHDIQIIEGMPNGKDYLLFYLKLLVESVDHEGMLRFNDTIPYNEQMLATITNTNVDVVRGAMKLFIELKMIEVLADETIYMAEVERMLGTETYWAEKKRVQRSKEKKELEEGQCPNNVQGESNLSKVEIDIEKELDIDIDKDIESKSNDDKSSPTPKKETKHKYGEYNNVRLTDTEYNKLIEEFGEDKILLYIKKVDEYVEQTGKKYKNHYLTIRNWISKDKDNKQSSKTVTYRKENKATDYEGQREFDPSLEARLLGWDK